MRYAQYPHYDHRGSVATLTDKSGTVVASYLYDAWGNILNSTESAAVEVVGNRFKYQSNWMYLGEGIYLSPARVYSSKVGRFLQKDPKRKGVNWYVYANDNPLTQVDPWGLDAVDDYVSDKYYEYLDELMKYGEFGDIYDEAKCEEIITVGHNSEVPQVIPGRPDPYYNNPCSAYATYACTVTSAKANPAFPEKQQRIPGALSENIYQDMGTGDIKEYPGGTKGVVLAETALIAAEMAYNSALLNVPNLCNGNCDCKEINIAVRCSESVLKLATGTVRRVCNLHTTRNC